MMLHVETELITLRSSLDTFILNIFQT